MNYLILILVLKLVKKSLQKSKVVVYTLEFMGFCQDFLVRLNEKINITIITLKMIKLILIAYHLESL
ncbi:hypothetical protein SAMN04489757_10441 [Anaerocolumna aminovalerica]|uniref:Uncharacterized protein n=1 Tax=Anaerocolumna aminovalerica TaxID=1527 RepID=A0A1I5CVB7_9FIRM|nr:hypothetical protein SAMN04489757_10441 [Anaerocolumna aminovalerica]